MDRDQGQCCVGPDFLNTPRLRLEDEPIHPTADDGGRVRDKFRPLQCCRAAVYINDQLVHRPAHPIFPDPCRKMAPDGSCPSAFAEWCRKIMDRVCTEARGNRLGIGVVECLDIRADDVLHALSRSGLCHGVVPPCVSRGSRLTPRPSRQRGVCGETRCVMRVCLLFALPVVCAPIIFVGETVAVLMAPFPTRQPPWRCSRRSMSTCSPRRQRPVERTAT